MGGPIDDEPRAYPRKRPLSTVAQASDRRKAISERVAALNPLPTIRDATTCVSTWLRGGRGPASLARQCDQVPGRPVALACEAGGFARPNHRLTPVVACAFRRRCVDRGWNSRVSREPASPRSDLYH